MRICKKCLKRYDGENEHYCKKCGEPLADIPAQSSEERAGEQPQASLEENGGASKRPSNWNYGHEGQPQQSKPKREPLHLSDDGRGGDKSLHMSQEEGTGDKSVHVAKQKPKLYQGFLKALVMLFLLFLLIAVILLVLRGC